MAVGMNLSVMLLYVKCAFLEGNMWRSLHIEQPCQDPRFGDGVTMGRLKEAMYGTCNAPQIWADTVRDNMAGLGLNASSLHPSVYWNAQRRIIVAGWRIS